MSNRAKTVYNTSNHSEEQSTPTVPDTVAKTVPKQRVKGTEPEWRGKSGFIPGDAYALARWRATRTEEQERERVRKSEEGWNRNKMIRSLHRAIREQLEQDYEHYSQRLQHALDSVIDRAIQNGDANAMATVWDRLVGKPASTVDMTVNQGADTQDELYRRISELAQQLPEGQALLNEQKKIRKE